MELFSILATCAALAMGSQDAHALDRPVSEESCVAASDTYRELLTSVQLTALDRDAIARVALAEAANQGDSGLAGVIYTIMNRLVSGRFGNSVSAVVNAPRQFEPVSKVGGQWQSLPKPSAAQQSRIDTIINLALEGHLPDVTNGALFFQNPSIVAQRESSGAVSKGLTHFGGSVPSAVIRDHAFYPSINSGGPVTVAVERPAAQTPKAAPAAWDIFATSRLPSDGESPAWDVYSRGDGRVIASREDQE